MQQGMWLGLARGSFGNEKGGTEDANADARNDKQRAGTML